MSSLTDKLEKKIKDKKARIGIMGMGYVGIPLGLEFAGTGFSVTGFDKDSNRVKEINSGKQVMKHIPAKSMKEFVKKNKGSATNKFSEIGDMDCLIICVPTPLDKHEQPDMSYIESASKEIGKNLRKGQLIVLESTTYPGTTREIVKPILEKSKLKAGEDFFLAYSPEREDPGNKEFSVSAIPKVMGGLTDDCLQLTSDLYKNIVSETVEVSSLETAEATKLMENIFRGVNIAMVNELKLVLSRMGVNIWEVIDAAKTKPFGFMAFYPGPGMGGHCIPIDPFYLAWKAKEYNTKAKFIELAGEINQKMTEHIAHRIGRALNDDKKSIRGSKILIVGVAYKKDIDDVRESPALRIMDLLKYKGGKINYHDPYVESMDSLKSLDLTKDIIEEQDAIVITTDHTSIDYTSLGKYAKLIVDTRNIMATVKNPKARVIRA
ncbi:MAG: nucleotide sugar dehydrogenase [Candidatus Poseidoniia archaeon]|jgi:UDP-N-acetyl-D-glucosamine dehydrogenase|nr:nucleotide sugar dehydrogenase [Candidatus Poseidoniia archaeon]MDP6441270.1 nucleotide sugar dehydrogenase [Candidatus Poseidoniia archaeon]MDP6591643.1 nucleotide sugar dehydrogenase [Candidatus Poseidoniia archaeon]MDP7095947.1 nucleotide sugar dehydrogenase [Candidatus Poseidoniia archaeon]MDP7187370.1 nucleotide sugar dehydrogenase [Candidatus Poseidoniia archaeon]|tara:strand:- start:389 stop:1693 length:1305 start_codon:yes stop_codon:yes gene_type:complete